MQLIQSLRERMNRRAHFDLQCLYRSDLGSIATRRIQLESFNRIWRTVSHSSRYYSALRAGGRVPSEFRSWDEFSQTMPLLDRSELKDRLDSIPLAHATPDYYRTTGGTTSTPIQLPAWRSEDRATGRNAWLARSWFGVTEKDRLFLLWGHSHLLGAGIHGKLNAAKRAIKDACLGYLRQSAYDLSEAKLRDAGERMLAFRPGYVLGYATALHRFAHFNRDRSSKFRQLNLKVAIATGECFPASDSSQRISEVLGCPVVMEYGAVETGVIAHQDRSGDYRVFWNTYYVEQLPAPNDGGAREIAVTALYPRLTPLIRYRIGDLVQSEQTRASALNKFGRVLGRSNDGIVVGHGGFVHSEAFSHIMRDIIEINSFQVIQRSEREILIKYTSLTPLSPDAIRLIYDRLRRIDRRLGEVPIQRVAVLESTVSGKAKRIVSALDDVSCDAA